MGKISFLLDVVMFRIATVSYPGKELVWKQS